MTIEALSEVMYRFVDLLVILYYKSQFNSHCTSIQHGCQNVQREFTRQKGKEAKSLTHVPLVCIYTLPPITSKLGSIIRLLV